MILTNISDWLRTAKIFTVALVCAAVLVVNSSPAFAFGMRNSAESSQGTAQLDEIYQESKQVTEGQPRGMDEVARKASQGLNSVQGAADTDKMKSSGDSQGATTIKDEAKDILESVID
ncbi:MAG: hypothetical protein AAF959_00975 [Cyanobacteria bacterium P01_D01_bin.56]